MADPTRLFVRPTGSTSPFDQRFDIFHTVNGAPARVNLCGFSFFGEVAGVSLGQLGPADKAIDLRGPGDPAPNPPPAPPKYSLTFEAYLDKLRGARINFLRLFVLYGFEVRRYPFAGSPVTKFQLHQVNTNYTDRLDYFIARAKERGIVVCVCLFAAQALSRESFPNDPFHFSRNDNGVIVDSAGSPAGIGRNDFCVIEQPPGQPSPYSSGWTQRQKLWWIQKNFVTAVVNATKSHWNVMYEIMNEPSPAIVNVVPWHATVAGWLKDLLWEPAAQRRSRLVVVNAADTLIENANAGLRLVDRLLPAGSPPLFDVFSFHGGGGALPSQWGGPHGRGRPAVCASAQAPTVDQIVNGADETVGTAVVHHRGILDAMRRFQSRPVALIFDTDAQYWAQKNVTPYVEEVLNVDGSYDYRWGDTFINAVSDADCADLQPLRFGLDQRLAKIAAARNKARITVFT